MEIKEEHEDFRDFCHPSPVYFLMLPSCIFLRLPAFKSLSLFLDACTNHPTNSNLNPEKDPERSLRIVAHGV